MYVCVCNAVTDRQLKQAIHDGATTLEELQKRIRVCTECQICLEVVTKILAETLEDIQQHP